MMWQHHYFIHQMQMERLRADADRARRWHLEDIENGRAVATTPGPGRVLVARGIATLSRVAARTARRLDGRANVTLGPERTLRDR